MADEAQKAIVDKDQLCVYEKPGWTKSLSPTNLPPYCIPPRRTRLTKLVLELHQKMKGELKRLFAKSGQRISLTTDTWTADHQNISCMCVTTQFINSDWVFEKKIIGMVFSYYKSLG